MRWATAAAHLSGSRPKTKEIPEALFAHYDKLDENSKAELPLKKIRMVAAPGDK